MLANKALVRTAIINITDHGIKYGWYPPLGIYVEARQRLWVDGEPWSLAPSPSLRQLLINDLNNHRVRLEYSFEEHPGLVQLGRQAQVVVQPQIAVAPPVPVAAEPRGRRRKRRAEAPVVEPPAKPHDRVFLRQRIEDQLPKSEPIFKDGPDKAARDAQPVVNLDDGFHGAAAPDPAPLPAVPKAASPAPVEAAPAAAAPAPGAAGGPVSRFADVFSPGDRDQQLPAAEPLFGEQWNDKQDYSDPAPVDLPGGGRGTEVAAAAAPAAPQGRRAARAARRAAQAPKTHTGSFSDFLGIKK